MRQHQPIAARFWTIKKSSNRRVERGIANSRLWRCLDRPAGSRISLSSRTWRQWAGAGAWRWTKFQFSSLDGRWAGRCRRALMCCVAIFRFGRTSHGSASRDAERDRDGLRNAVAALRKLGRGRMFLGGHSYGGRQATMLCAAERDLVAGLLLLSYPLHPPRKPTQLRVQHLPDLRVPALFVHGTRHPFGSVEEMEAAVKMIPARTELLTVDGAGHDLAFKGRVPGELTGGIVAAFSGFFGRMSSLRSTLYTSMGARAYIGP